MRLNEFIWKLKPDPRPKAKGRPKAAPAQPPSLEAAMLAALSCSKCRETKIGQKGCQKCMGDWFQTTRAHKAHQ